MEVLGVVDFLLPSASLGGLWDVERVILVNDLLDLRIVLLLRLIVHPVGLPAASGAVFLVGVVPLEGLLVGGVRFDVHQHLLIVLLIF